MNLNKKSIFLFDGAGAVLSVLFTGLILPLFTHWTGLPKPLLYSLALFPFIYAVFSLSCYQFVTEHKPWMLLTIIVANLLYSLISGLVIFAFDEVTLWGKALLVTEILVILGVVAIEFKIYRESAC